jgi:hypothetical protein
MILKLIGAIVWLALLVGPVRLDARPTMVERVPEPNPPVIELDIPAAPEPRAPAPEARALDAFKAPSATPTIEWGYHKTSDNLHPDGNEQQMLWLLNRARSNPTQEGIWLATMTDPDVTAARNFWGVDLGVLQTAFAAIPVRPPAAFDVRLYTAARAHSDYLISIDDQTHTGQFTRIDAAGFRYTAAAGIVFSYSEHTVYGHAGFNIDWGFGPYGMQDPPGHRNAIMSTNTYYSNVGYAVVPETEIATQVGPQVITGNLAYANTGFPDHFNRFIVGTVWEDTNGNGQYDPGEGLGGVTVMPDSGTYYAVTGDSGGYSIPVDAGTYTVSFAGGELAGGYTRTVAVGSNSVVQDLEYFAASGTPPVTAGGSPAPGGGSSGGGGGGGGGGCFIVAAGTGAHPAGLPAALLAAAGVVAAIRGTGTKAN